MLKNRLRACVLFIALFSFVSRPSQLQACRGHTAEAILLGSITAVLVIPIIVVSSLKSDDSSSNAALSDDVVADKLSYVTTVQIVLGPLVGIAALFTVVMTAYAINDRCY